MLLCIISIWRNYGAARSPGAQFGFDFIECFTTTFLHAHSWLNWVECTVWKGTSQDCVDHMRNAHNTPVVVKAGNLARWFPPWTVTREQWHSMSRPSVSGIAIDTFLFSHIGMPLFHRYRVFDRQGGHPAFRGPYMPRLFDFLQEADAESIRRSHRRRAKEIAASTSKGASTNKESQATTSSSRRMVQRTSAARIRGREQGTSLILVAERRQKTKMSSCYQRSAEKHTVQALMDLSLPRFTKLDDGVIPKTKPWQVTLDSPTSPTSVDGGNRTRSPSPCVDLDGLSSDDSGAYAPPQDLKVTLLYDSDDLCTPVGSIVFSSDEDLPLCPGQDDRHKVCKRNSRPSSRSELLDRPANEPARIEKSVDMNNDSMTYKPPVDDSKLMPLITLKNSPVVDKTNMTGCPLPNGSEVLLPRSPETVGFKVQDVSSAPLSPNRVKEGHSQDMPAEGSIFDVSPDLPGYSMRPAGGGLQLSDTAQTPPSRYGSFNDRSSEHRSLSLSVTRCRGWIPR